MHVRALALALGLLPSALLASDGVIELNHAKALAGDSSLFPPDAPGYPIEIRNPGSYRLTSDLSVPAGASGIVLMADLVNLDLGGFAIRGSEPCFPGGCAPATNSSGIVHDPGGGGGFVSVRNGDVSYFGASCIRLRDGGRVENVRVIGCGEHGIHLRAVFFPSSPGTAFGNYVTNTGSSSLVFEAGGLFRDNVLQNAGLAVASPTIVGGTATGGNLCDDGLCSRRGTRRYYLSKNVANGSQALTACQPGFHMASRWEIADPSALEYDPVNGRTSPDSGKGPPAAIELGWVRLGATATSFGPNCLNWTSASDPGGGVVAQLDPLWAHNLFSGSTSRSTPWTLGFHGCGNPNPVWCIED